MDAKKWPAGNHDKQRKFAAGEPVATLNILIQGNENHGRERAAL